MNFKKIMNIVVIVFSLFLFITVSKLIAFLFIIGYVAYINLATIIYLIGNNKYKKNEKDEAYKYFDKAYKMKGSSVKTKLSCVYFLLLKGELDEAEKILKQLSTEELSSDNEINIKLNTSIIMWKRNNIEEAVKILMELYKKYKTTIIYQNLGYFLILKKDYAKAMEINLEAYDYNSTNAGILDNLAMTYYMQGEYDKSLKVYEKLMIEKPNFPSAYYYYALTLIKINKNEDALQNLKQALKCNFTFLSTISKEKIEATITERESSKK
ncbi:tetratricopeptide repeat protein [Clostridium sp.]|uniref:tetratricopeptide repeat protein n=1 Tax=Clostridium sp. TaxID=1506 RepID=UPI0026157CD9|nr:tetratricopeptide repeat protein [uncultured Clostridium sp.]